eukprot:1116305-Pleurochrysis_carterae.AAC.1
MARYRVLFTDELVVPTASARTCREMNSVSGMASVQYGTCARCVKSQRRDRKACVAGREVG